MVLNRRFGSCFATSQKQVFLTATRRSTACQNQGMSIAEDGSCSPVCETSSSEAFSVQVRSSRRFIRRLVGRLHGRESILAESMAGKHHDSAQKAAPGRRNRSGAAFARRIPAITDFRAKGTIMGLAGLTAVFGMGTGVTPPVWSPEK